LREERRTSVASICHRSLETSRTKRLDAFGSPRGLQGDEVVASKHLVDRGDCRRCDPCPSELRSDPARSPPGVILAQTADRRVELGIDLGRAAVGPSIPVLQALQALGQVPLAIAVVGLPGDLIATVDLGHRLAGSLGLHEHVEP
jgi:hypothetical protein